MRTMNLTAVVVCLSLAAAAFGQQPVSLIDPAEPTGGWTFGNGPEFPGAEGELGLADEPYLGKPVLMLQGDFTQGGGYVQASVGLPAARIKALSFSVNCPAGAEHLPIRYTDANARVHQVRLRLDAAGGWQQIVFPVETFFSEITHGRGLDIVTQYQTWDGAKDSQQHDKPHPEVPGLAILATRHMGDRVTVLVSDVQCHPSAQTTVTRTIRLDEMLQAGEIDWGFNLGQEFPGAKGGLELVRNEPEAGHNAFHLHADFTGGGGYVGMRRRFSQLDVQSIEALRMRMRSQTTRSFGIRLVDSTGQCHQRKNMSLTADGKWHDVELVPEKIAGGEHWGGANDGKWHGSVQLIELMLNVQSHEGKKPDLYITDVQADVAVAAALRPAAYAAEFDADDSLQAGWQLAGAVGLDAPGREGQGKALRLQRTVETLQTDTQALSPTFAVTPGPWCVQYAWKAALHSPDDSYHGAVGLEVLDRAGKVLETSSAGIGYGEKPWQEVSASVVLPPGAAKARVRVELRKTYGSLWLDELRISPVSIGPVERRIDRVLLATDVVGSLFLPGEPIVIHATVEALKPLPQSQQTLHYSLRDYWGAEQMPAGEVALSKAPGRNERFVYTAEIDIPVDRLAVGKYHELHVGIPQPGAEPVREHTGLAVLPPAVTKQYQPEQVPFTIRNWDSRVPAYFHLADRLGLRLLGVWGGWSAKPPYKPHCPGIDLCAQFGAKWVTGTPGARIERSGFSQYSEESLRQGMRNFLEQYADQGLAMVCLGNEPHGTGEKVQENVRAYRALYETIKAFDPEIHVVGTSVEPNEEYFKAGYQNYLDSYDFHIYEHYTNVRRTMREYRALMEKYGAVKPIHSTELGLNSQGQTRLAVGREMVRKFTVFFAEGGATVSWFTIQYPDPKGKARGQFGDAHCVFDCKYNLYNPRLDAIVYYNMVNGIGAKRFVEERHYPNGAQAYLFRDTEGRCLQILWLDGKREDAFVSLPDNLDVQLVEIDGTQTRLRSASGGVSVTAFDDPLLLLYRAGEAPLAGSLAQPAATLVAAPAPVGPGGTAAFTLAGKGLTAQSIRLDRPPLWQAAAKQAGDNRVEVTLRAPPATPAREARVHVDLVFQGEVTGRLTVPVPVAGD